MTYSFTIYISVYFSAKTACCIEERVLIVCHLINWIQIDSNEGQYLIPKRKPFFQKGNSEQKENTKPTAFSESCGQFETNLAQSNLW